MQFEWTLLFTLNVEKEEDASFLLESLLKTINKFFLELVYIHSQELRTFIEYLSLFLGDNPTG